jgi:hypothetical protein
MPGSVNASYVPLKCGEMTPSPHFNDDTFLGPRPGAETRKTHIKYIEHLVQDTRVLIEFLEHIAVLLVHEISGDGQRYHPSNVPRSDELLQNVPSEILDLLTQVE